MKSILAILAFLICQQYVFAQGTRQIQNRKIKKVSSCSSEMKKGELQKQWIITEYNRKGQIVSETTLDNDSLVKRREEYTYLRNGKISRYSFFDRTKGQTSSLHYYDRFERDTLIETTDSSGTIIQKTRIVYDKEDNKTEESIYDQENTLKQKTTFQYDKRGMLTRRKTVNSKGETISEKVNEYVY